LAWAGAAKKAAPARTRKERNTGIGKLVTPVLTPLLGSH